MHLSEYLNDGQKLNEAVGQFDIVLLLRGFEARTADPLQQNLIRAAQLKLDGEFKTRTFEERRVLMELARQWYRLDKGNREKFKSFFDEPDTLASKVGGSGPKLRKFYGHLSELALGNEPQKLAEAWFQVHELAVQLREYKRMEDWPVDFGSAVTIWWFSTKN